jgi:hypothetical protein
VTNQINFVGVEIKADLSQLFSKPRLLAWTRFGEDDIGSRRLGHSIPKQRLLRLVVFEKLSRFFEVEGVSVDDQLVFAGVFRDGNDAVDTMAVLPESLDDEIDVYHG